MVAVVGLLQFCHHVIVGVVQSPPAVGHVHLLRQQLNVGLPLRQQLLLGDAAYGLILGSERQLLQVVQFAEHRQLRELRDTSQEDEAQVLRLCLQRRE